MVTHPDHALPDVIKVRAPISDLSFSAGDVFTATREKSGSFKGLFKISEGVKWPLYIRVHGCAHLGGLSWEVVE
ncbi:hypothetical protein [Hafnia phage Pocis76]|uniref:Uncharacterized protein n=1 Tax=Hafnia phage Pocis76 TaxID=2831174 RepID=A0A8E7KXQ5_9CAUD|nr:hypothetical protein [Hafnia phage Pocis76]